MKYYLITHHFTNTNHVTLELISESNSTNVQSLGMIGVDSNGVVQNESLQYQAFDVEHYSGATHQQTHAYHTRDFFQLNASQAGAITDYATNLIGQNTSGNSVDLLNNVLDAAGVSTELSAFFDDDKDSLSFAYASLVDFFTQNDPGTLGMWQTFTEDLLLDFRIDTAAIDWFADNFGPVPSTLHYLEAYEYAYNTVVSQGYNGLSSEEFEQFDSPWGSLGAFVDDPDYLLDQDGNKTVARADLDMQFDIESATSDLDGAFSELMTWVDANINGQTDGGELVKQAEYNVNPLRQDYTPTDTHQEASLVGDVSTAEVVGVQTEVSAMYFVNDTVA